MVVAVHVVIFAVVLVVVTVNIVVGPKNLPLEFDQNLVRNS